MIDKVFEQKDNQFQRLDTQEKFKLTSKGIQTEQQD